MVGISVSTTSMGSAPLENAPPRPFLIISTAEQWRSIFQRGGASIPTIVEQCSFSSDKTIWKTYARETKQRAKTIYHRLWRTSANSATTAPTAEESKDLG